MDLRERYLDLLEDILTGSIIEDPPIPTEGYRRFLSGVSVKMGGDGEVPDWDLNRYNPHVRDLGWDYPANAFTMVGRKRLRNFRQAIEQVLAEGIAGDIIETGVWRGGAAILARAVLAAHGDTARKVIAADSFEGLPPPDPAFPRDEGTTLHEQAELAVSLETVRGNFAKFRLLDDQVVFLKGWFRDTMPAVTSQRLAVMRLDGDMYESTIDPLNHLFDRLSPGGFVIVDDYGLLPPCKAAVQDFLGARGLRPEIHDIDGQGVFFRKA